MIKRIIFYIGIVLLCLSMLYGIFMVSNLTRGAMDLLSMLQVVRKADVIRI